MVRAAPLGVPRPTRLALIAVLLLLLPACIVRKLKVVRPGIASSAKLQTASLQQLVRFARVNWKVTWIQVPERISMAKEKSKKPAHIGLISLACAFVTYMFRDAREIYRRMLCR